MPRKCGLDEHDFLVHRKYQNTTSPLPETQNRGKETPVPHKLNLHSANLTLFEKNLIEYKTPSLNRFFEGFLKSQTRKNKKPKKLTLEILQKSKCARLYVATQHF